ncbi:MAG: hypothetical protein HOP07_02705 [Bacteriovoracaceae bacterium]|nr:hypothetical protein [Bacteriovoracaceae bacterium]
MAMQKFIIFIISIILSGCVAKGKVAIIMKSNLKQSVLNLNIASVRIQNNQLIINGSNLESITTVKLVEGGLTQTLAVESATNGEVIANGVSAITLGVGKVFDMILSNANAAATFPVSFTLNDGSVTKQKLSSMGALSGQVLKFNGTTWEPAS